MRLSEVEPLSTQLRGKFKEWEIYIFITNYILQREEFVVLSF
jgi:hypothetical protein